jgi:serine protease DegQ
MLIGLFHLFCFLAITTMRKSWLLFSQFVTVFLAVYFVVVSLKPEWLQRGSHQSALTVLEAPAGSTLRIAGGSPGSFSTAAKAASGAVVSIIASKAAVRTPNTEDPWFRFFFGDQVRNETQVGLGSGVIVSPNGYILTNNHVIEGADDIEVILIDSRKAKAKVIGTDPETDLAILKIELAKLPVIVLGSSESIEIGDQVLAIGNPFGVGQTVTGGIISALGRSQLGINVFENFIQTDAAINPGNSGGALVDTQGRLLGINTAIYSRSGGSMGIGFAIPVSTARQVLESIVRDGQVTRGWIGVEPQELNAELAQTFNISAKSGVIITGVLQNGPAAAAGIRPGDVITAVANKPVSNVTELLSAVAALKPGESSLLKVQRRDVSSEVPVTPSKRQRPALPR